MPGSEYYDCPHCKWPYEGGIGNCPNIACEGKRLSMYAHKQNDEQYTDGYADGYQRGYADAMEEREEKNADLLALADRLEAQAKLDQIYVERFAKDPGSFAVREHERHRQLVADGLAAATIIRKVIERGYPV